MRFLSSLIAVGSLFLAVAVLPAFGVLFAMILFGGFLLALVGVLSGQEDRTVQQHDPSMDPTGWRKGG